MSGPLLSGFHSGSWHRPRVAIVDSRPPAEDLVQEFNRQGYACLHVQSAPYVPGGDRERTERGYRREDFIADVVHEGDLDRTLAAVAAFAPSAVIAGSAVGGPFADLLADALGLPGNHMTLSQERGDGSLTVETVRAAGLQAVRQVRVLSERPIAECFRDLGGRVVIKSGGGAPVAFCDTPQQAVAAYRALTGGRSLTKRRREVRVVAQEYLPGTEYTLTTVSCDGLHRLCEVWRSSRLSANNVPDLCGALSLLGADAPEVGPLGEYARRVLDALGIRHGPAHLEVRMTPAGPCLLAAGAWLPGPRLTGSLAATARLGAGESQVEWAVDACLRPERFARRAERPYGPARSCALVGMVSPVAGVLRAYRGLNRVRALESFHDLAFTVRPGEQLRRTVDTRTVPMRVTLCHELAETVERDLHTLRHLDGAGMYDVEDGPARAA